MKSSSLPVVRSNQLFDALFTDKTLALIASGFLMSICFGIIFWGKPNYSLALLLVLTTYASFIGFYAARRNFRQRLSKQQDYDYLKLLAAHCPETVLLIDRTTQQVLFQNKAFDQDDTYVQHPVYDFIDSIGLHAIDHSKITRFFRQVPFTPFCCIVQKSTYHGKTQWLSIEAQLFENAPHTPVLLSIQDITEQQEVSLTQQQYIKDMENIIRQQSHRTPLHFLSKMASARDIQRPLHTLRQYVQLIEKDYRNQLDEKGQQYLQHIAQSSYHVQTLFEDLFRLAGLDLEDTQLEQVDTGIIVQQVMRKLQDDITASQAAISYPKLPNIRADRHQLALLFHNLIDNAIKYCGSQPPRILIRCNQMDGHWVFSVSDQGMGINTNFKQQIFDFLQRGKQAAHTNGIGMGLAICKKIIENHQGDIWVESAGAGKGCTFYFTIPLEQQQAPLYRRAAVGQPMAVTA